MASTVTLEKIDQNKVLSFTRTGGQFLLSSPKDGKTSQKKSKEIRSCRSSKCELVDYHSLPSFLKHNEFIVGYYRSEWALKETILSIFSIHNETLNIWTHLVGFFIFLALATSAATTMMAPAEAVLPSFDHPLLILPAIFQSNRTIVNTGPTESIHSVPRWPFYAYLAGAMFCLLASSACHLLSCHSERCSYTLLRLDYAGISTLIVTSFYPLVYYSFACLPFYRDLYLAFITVFGVATILVSLFPAFETPEFRVARAGLFACMALSGVVPIVHKVVAFGDRPEAALTTGYEMAMGVFYGLGVVVYAARLPERWMPGRFDLAGHSHQLFHVLVVAGAYTHYLAGLVYLSWREMEGC